jgi:hypothetical protein
VEVKLTGASQERQDCLPVRYSLTLTRFFSFVIAGLVAITAVASIVFRKTIYPTEELRRAFVPNDVINLFIGLPMLLGSIGLTQRDNLVGLLCWPGALLYILYNYLVYVFAMPLNVAFPSHLTLVALSVCTLIGLVANIDGDRVRQQLTGSVHEKVIGGILAGLGLLFFLQATGVLAHIIANRTPIAKPELAVHIADFLVTPTWVVGGILLWRRKELGYAIGLGLFFQASMLLIGLIVFLLLQPFLTGAPFAFASVVVVFVMGLLCFIPFALFARSASPRAERKG